MKKITLNGTWNYRIGNGKWEAVTVPFSRLPVGHSECFRTFDWEKCSDKVYNKCRNERKADFSNA